MEGVCLGDLVVELDHSGVDEAVGARQQCKEPKGTAEEGEEAELEGRGERRDKENKGGVLARTQLALKGAKVVQQKEPQEELRRRPKHHV